MKRLIFLLFVILPILIYIPAYSSELVTFVGSLEKTFCPEVCGTCCTDALLKEKNNGFSVAVKGTHPNLALFIDDGKNHKVSGYFYPGKGACNSGDCTFFFITSIGSATPDAAIYQTATGILHIPSISIDRTGQFALDIAAPCKVLSGEVLDTEIVVGQGQDCSAANAQCEDGVFCVTYFGFAGPSGPLFQTCEIPCQENEDCPAGQHCATVADGPGQVCIAD